MIFDEFLEAIGVNYKLLKPKGYSNYFKDKEFFKRQTGWVEQTNNDSRAASAMIWLNK